jgi:hypothetical protein
MMGFTGSTGPDQMLLAIMRIGLSSTSGAGVACRPAEQRRTYLPPAIAGVMLAEP